MSRLGRIVVVGGGLAALRAVEALRREGHDGELVLVAAERHLPYDRPPLSKEYLAGAVGPEALALRRQGFDDLAVELRLGAAASSLDLGARTVTVGADTLRYDGLVLAPGSTPRQLPGITAREGVHVLRTVEDADALRAVLAEGRRLCVIGAGFIGAEVAATARELGHDVTVVEALDQPMVRAVGPALGELLAQLHRDRGVDLRLGRGVERVSGAGRVERVELTDGDVVECDAVLVAIGVVPTVAWLEGSGLTLDDGIVCDAALRAAPGVVAAGDACRWPNPLFDDEVMRIEHWTNAAEQGAHAARSLLAGADAEPFSTVPFVWSDQYDVKIQSVGRFGGEDRVEIVHGRPGEMRFVALFERAGRLRGALGFSQPRRVMQYRRMIADRESFSAAMAFAAEHS